LEIYLLDQLKIACIGEAMIEIAFDGVIPLVNFAGDALNTAVYLRRNLPSRHSVSFVSVVGCDIFSIRMLDFIEAEGILVDHISKHPNLCLAYMRSTLPLTESDLSFTGEKTPLHEASLRTVLLNWKTLT
jgi:sugar/nucleoside kinase (ribokinase family)